jgi:hypothetical protein
VTLTGGARAATTGPATALAGRVESIQPTTDLGHVVMAVFDGTCADDACGQVLIRPVSWAHIAISTRFRASSLRMRLTRWVLTVLMLMWSSSAISLLVRPRATGTRISSSRLVSGSMGCAGGGPAEESAKTASSRG